ncbi:hypothetical protein SAMN05661080_02033 [Modestobacter sp. DSM 44400]|uniref:hypothetical protein n=1 Tax=Modestobacter sp. DSM 44400 TaxID=1550230 RepID=UPI0008949E38|nr:hypothetical protein [Modestobacter sp. DSM 44400]SDY01996.1 hypothetical protein SAMN05661080_02033 [Modestobacter sp. DSM 44400]
MTLTALNPPTSTTYAAAYPTSALNGTPTAGCDATSTATSSEVTYRYATGTSGSSHTRTTALVIATSGQANSPLTATLTNDAAMAGTC